MPQPDIVLFYADLDRNYLRLIERMTRSAKLVMPESRLVLITPTPKTELQDLFDKTIDVSPYMTTTDATVCYDRVCAMVSWQALTKNRTVYIDPDLEFRKPVVFSDDFDVGLLWRKKKPDQPINTGLILANPGFNSFWARYGAIAANLPGQLRSWWCDQLAFSVLLGVLHEAGDTVDALDARVKLIDWREACAPEEHATEDTWAIHYKGDRKNGPRKAAA